MDSDSHGYGYTQGGIQTYSMSQGPEWTVCDWWSYKTVTAWTEVKLLPVHYGCCLVHCKVGCAIFNMPL